MVDKQACKSQWYANSLNIDLLEVLAHIKRGNLMFQIVEELKGILLEAADDMKPSFHPNRWGYSLTKSWSKIVHAFCVMINGPWSWILGQIQLGLPSLPQRHPWDWLVCLQLVNQALYWSEKLSFAQLDVQFSAYLFPTRWDILWAPSNARSIVLNRLQGKH